MYNSEQETEQLVIRTALEVLQQFCEYIRCSKSTRELLLRSLWFLQTVIFVIIPTFCCVRQDFRSLIKPTHYLDMYGFTNQITFFTM